MAYETKLNLGNIVAPKGAAIKFGSESSSNNLNISTENEHSNSPYNIIITEENALESIPAEQVTYSSASLSSDNVQDAIDELKTYIDNKGGSVFVATYGTTTYNEMLTAYNEQSPIHLNINGQILPLDAYVDNQFRFSTSSSAGVQVNTWYILSSSGWATSSEPSLSTNAYKSTATPIASDKAYLRGIRVSSLPPSVNDGNVGDIWFVYNVSV